ncbi:membrane bound hydrogenase, MbhE subunit [Methanolacinia petrolearia DSM 11571]|uniref:Membrane bound hydrogenase, MbhE subunit n=1 Tax=Methanolacinia petrolearia (strain DSM 11571 / OCM 486 / SEBR 4847) TaxID=679926 RepID=E1RGP2_METP4|nr:hydrogen gas-evolving membrane-bound hydrogenase subunit E [Methanolacinia petrolearia]ADN36337.1 membrane bound hydrogenase, MbhE subunit [Methanolacinia petrolearia DSM 11571]
MSTKGMLTAAIIIILTASLLFPATVMSFGSPAHDEMDNYMIDNGQELSAANNIVTAVVFDFRGFDTLGEATVLFTAVLGVTLMFRRMKEDEEYEYE